MSSTAVWRLGLVRLATSVLIVLVSGTLNRVMVAELGVSAGLVGLLFSVQHFVTPVGILSGHLSDRFSFRGYRRSPYILGGLVLAAMVLPLFPWLSDLLYYKQDSCLTYLTGVTIFALFGVGVTVSATGVNALLVDLVPKPHRGRAMALVWIMTLLGFIVGSLISQILLPIYSRQGLIRASWTIAAIVVVLGMIGGWRIEPAHRRRPQKDQQRLRESILGLVSDRSLVWFCIFLAMSSFFFFLQEFILEPYGGEVLGYIVSTTTSFNLFWASGVLIGMIILTTAISKKGRRLGRVGLGSSFILGSLALSLLAATSLRQVEWLVFISIMVFGLSKGLYNVGLSDLTMRLVREQNSGAFMGLWNMVAGLSIASGESVGGVLRDWLNILSLPAHYSYAIIFFLEAVGLLCCLVPLLMIRTERPNYKAIGQRNHG